MFRSFFIKTKNVVFGSIKSFFALFSFMILVVLYSFAIILNKIFHKVPVLNRVFFTLLKWVKSLDKLDTSGVSQMYLIEISFKNMSKKKTRTLITIGGMAIGISFIVFLVSVGYGLEQLVLSRVARLDELSQAEVVPGLSKELKINDGTITRFKEITHVKDALPLIAVVGRVSYENSVTDLAVYGATTNYLKNSAIQPATGRFYESNDLSFDASKIKSDTIYGELGEKINDVTYSITTNKWVPVYETSSVKSKVLGYTKKITGESNATEVWGETYTSTSIVGKAGLDGNGLPIGKWLNSTFLIWKKEVCEVETNGDCESGNYVIDRDIDNTQKRVDGYLTEVNVSVTVKKELAPVLGVEDEKPTTKSDGSLPLVEIKDDNKDDIKIKEVSVKTIGKKEAVINRSVLQLLNLSEEEAVGSVIDLSMVVVGELLDNSNDRIESTAIKYTIVGVIPDEGTPIIYVPFIDVRSLGVNNFSQTKIIVDTKENLPIVRASIESGGYGTVSVADTVTQIDTLFANFRLLLSILGMVALSVAALGMFNTLTISLLERTREVGLMKAMGMKSDEVKSLFLTESMIMGLYGGILGLLLGYSIGKLLSLILSTLSVVKGVGYVEVSYIPPTFMIIVILLSVFVGVATGYFPAKRATRISALNALRYE
jgi:ABC-type antimicrobial peptide transport system permease subunit